MSSIIYILNPVTTNIITPFHQKKAKERRNEKERRKESRPTHTTTKTGSNRQHNLFKQWFKKKLIGKH